MAASSPVMDTAAYGRQISTDSGWENPFRPDGDLSREADEIVELIKEGKPITANQNSKPHDTTDSNALGDGREDVTEELISPTQANSVLAASPVKSGANGSAPTEMVTPESVEVQHGIVVPASDGSQVEHVIIKKKSKCKCCVIQ